MEAVTLQCCQRRAQIEGSQVHGLGNTICPGVFLTKEIIFVLPHYPGDCE